MLAYELSNDRSLVLKRRTRIETVDFLKKHKLEETLRKQKEWKFDEAIKGQR